jgi:hypothetical protein
MSEPSAFGFGQFVPGFDFLQNLSKTAAQAAPAAGAVPGVASWVAPTLSIEEIDKRIQELKAVQFWLDQNATALKATIQAMEVQKMTLSTLQSMNVNMADLAKAFTAKPPTPEAAPEAAPTPKTSIFSPKPEPAPEVAPAPQPTPEKNADTQAETKPQTDTQAHAASDKPAVDPMQWWSALTQQFQGIAAAAMKDVAGEAMKAGMAAQQAASAEPSANGKRQPQATTAKASSKVASKVAGKPSAKAKTSAAPKPAPAKAAQSAQAANAAKTVSAAKAAKSASQREAPSAPRTAAKKRAAP